MVRHGDWNYRLDGLLPGEAERATLFRRAKLSEFIFSKVYCSEANRAYETAKALCPEIEPERLDDLTEFPSDPEWRKKVLQIQLEQRKDLVEIVFSFPELRKGLRERSGLLSFNLYQLAESNSGDILAVSHGVTMTGLILATKEDNLSMKAIDIRIVFSDHFKEGFKHNPEDPEDYGAGTHREEAKRLEAAIENLWAENGFRGNRFGPLDAIELTPVADEYMSCAAGEIIRSK